MIPVCVPTLNGNELKYITECIETNWISAKGEFVERFQDGFSDFCNTEYGIAVCNGTVAIHLALLALGLSEGDEVIVPSLTTVATINPVVYCGAKPVFVDSEPDTWNIDSKKIEEKITPHTKAILVVHLYGHPCDMDPIMKISDEYGIPIIEDAAEAHGAMYKNRIVGGIGHIGCFSFYANKIITTGEGGMVVTNNPEYAEKMKSLKDLAYGVGVNRFVHSDIGYNYRMTNMQAAIGLAQLEKIEDYIKARRKVAETYNCFLKNFGKIELPPEKEWAKNVYWMYTILVKKNAKISRDELIIKLKEKGIDTRPAFHPAHLQPIYSNFVREEKLPISEDIGARGINLPSSNSLNDEDIKYITDSIKKVL